MTRASVTKCTSPSRTKASDTKCTCPKAIVAKCTSPSMTKAIATKCTSPSMTKVIDTKCTPPSMTKARVPRCTYPLPYPLYPLLARQARPRPTEKQPAAHSPQLQPWAMQRRHLPPSRRRRSRPRNHRRRRSILTRPATVTLFPKRKAHVVALRVDAIPVVYPSIAGRFAATRAFHASTGGGGDIYCGDRGHDHNYGRVTGARNLGCATALRCYMVQ